MLTVGPMTLAEGQALVLKNLSCQFVASVGLVIVIVVVVVAVAILQGKTTAILILECLEQIGFLTVAVIRQCDLFLVQYLNMQ